jgi:hypothetical protein
MSIQSIPRCGLFSVIYLDLTSDKALIGFNPLLSASAVGIPSNASANALTAYYSTVDIFFFVVVYLFICFFFF